MHITSRGLSPAPSKGFISLGLILVLVIAAALIGGGAYYASKQSPAAEPYIPPESASTTPGTLPGQVTENPSQPGTEQSATASCEAFAHLKRGDTDASTGGQVTQLQQFLGISPTTGSYGPLTGIGYTNKCVGGNAAPDSVPSMSKYTDSAFGFSFWYPSGWTVSKNNFGTLTISDGSPDNTLTISEVQSTDGAQVNGHLGWTKFYFDPSAGEWMESSGVYDGNPAFNTQPANVSLNSMGGLHLLQTGQTFNPIVIPLSATNFLVFGYGQGDASDINRSKTGPLAKTIVATDPTVAIPVSTAEQTAAIQAEASAYGVASNLSPSSACPHYTVECAAGYHAVSSGADANGCALAPTCVAN